MSRFDRRCISCIHYDGSICTKDLNNLDYSYVIDTMYKAPNDTCKEYEEDTEYEEEDATE